MEIPDELLQIVVFLEIKDEHGFYEPIGTAFGINYIHEEEGRAWGHTYLVTCRHVVESYLKSGKSIYVRVNRKVGYGIGHLPLSSEWVYPEDSINGEVVDRVDIAILHWQKDIVNYDAKETAFSYSTVPYQIFSGRAGMWLAHKKSLSVGNEIVFFGLFQEFTGHKRLHQLTRFGRISMLTKEKIPGVMPEMGAEEYYLVECQLYKGMSGSPAFIRINDDGKNALSLMGVMAGYYLDSEHPDRHSGISLMVPVEKIWSILGRQDMIDERSALQKKFSKSENRN